MKMDIQAPLTVFLDEAGAPDFGMPIAGEPKKAHVVCAVAMPNIAFKSFHSIIPRNAAGEYLKSSHVDFNKDLALIFVNHLISSNAEVGPFLADTEDPKNVELAIDKPKLPTMAGPWRAREKYQPRASTCIRRLGRATFITCSSY